jgi:2-keto-4-pentenoate hydratase
VPGKAIDRHSGGMRSSDNTITARDGAIVAAAERLVAAAATGVPCSPVRDLIGNDDLAAAYAVQRRVVAHRKAAGATVVGRKIGLTSPSVQRQLGVDQPDLGVLFDDMEFIDGAAIPCGALLQPRIEAEVAFVLGADLFDGPLDTAQVRGSIGYVLAALEICDSRIASWDISFGDTVADNASAGAYVLGAQRRTLDDVEPVDVVMSMAIDGHEVSAGNGSACLGDPIAAVAWLARTARELGQPLEAGQLILSGALGPIRPVGVGNVAVATLSGLGTVTTRFIEGDEA